MKGDVATTAGGHELEHKGRCKVNTVVDGFDVPIAFSNIKVDVPILGVRRMVKLGNGVLVTDSGGTITNRATGTTRHFIEAEIHTGLNSRLSGPIPIQSNLTTRI